MFSKILIPTDGSDLSLGILWTLRPLVIGSEPEITLLRVVVPGDEQPEAAVQGAREELAATQELLEAWGFSASVRLELDGDPADQILACAEELSVDLVAMSSHGRSGITRMVRGSVAERVLRRCTTPLLMCTPTPGAVAEYPQFRRILVPLDGSELADQILPDVQNLATACGAEVTLMRVEGLLSEPPSRVLRPTWWTDERVEELLAPMKPQRDALAKAGVSVGRQLAYGNPADHILRAARKADLVAMTTHGRSGASRWFFGSVAEAVLREADCPLLIRRVAPGAGADAQA
jgi:nucleotide-binding universal stress UspA family protein